MKTLTISLALGSALFVACGGSTNAAESPAESSSAEAKPATTESAAAASTAAPTADTAAKPADAKPAAPTVTVTPVADRKKGLKKADLDAAMKLANEGDAWDKAQPALEKKLGKATYTVDAKYDWVVVGPKDCTVLEVENKDGKVHVGGEQTSAKNVSTSLPGGITLNPCTGEVTK